MIAKDLSETHCSEHPDRARRSDGIASREQLLRAALQLFAEKGFANTSTREIARAAGSNVASISYYFGDKAGLYRAAFREPMGALEKDSVALYENERFTLHEALEGIISYMAAPLKQGEMAYLSLRLRNRELVEPTGLLAEDLEALEPALMVLTRVLQRHLKLEIADNDVRRLAFSIFALSVQQLSFHDLLKQICPELIDSPADYDAQVLRSLRYAEALVESERRRRRGRSGAVRSRA